MTASGQKGLLMATMEPPATMEEEFQDWYDTEHVPERRNYPGFETANRWVCVDGWPRWLATYDLESVDAVQTPQYLSTNGDKASPWSKRILSRLAGRRRVVATQIAPGNELCLPAEKVSRLLLALHLGRKNDNAIRFVGVHDVHDGPEQQQDLTTMAGCESIDEAEIPWRLDLDCRELAKMLAERQGRSIEDVEAEIHNWLEDRTGEHIWTMLGEFQWRTERSESARAEDC